MHSLAYIFTVEKPRSILYLAINFLFVNRFPKFLWHFLRLLACKRLIKSHFAGGTLEQGDMQKGSFQRMVCKESYLKHTHMDKTKSFF